MFETLNRQVCECGCACVSVCGSVYGCSCVCDCECQSNVFPVPPPCPNNTKQKKLKHPKNFDSLIDCWICMSERIMCELNGRWGFFHAWQVMGLADQRGTRHTQSYILTISIEFSLNGLRSLS